MIQKSLYGYVISSAGTWLPGVYDSVKSARYAFRFTDEDLEKLYRAKRIRCGRRAAISHSDLMGLSSRIGERFARFLNSLSEEARDRVLEVNEKRRHSKIWRSRIVTLWRINERAKQDGTSSPYHALFMRESGLDPGFELVGDPTKDRYSVDPARGRILR